MGKGERQAAVWTKPAQVLCPGLSHALPRASGVDPLESWLLPVNVLLCACRRRGGLCPCLFQRKQWERRPPGLGSEGHRRYWLGQIGATGFALCWVELCPSKSPSPQDPRL